MKFKFKIMKKFVSKMRRHYFRSLLHSKRMERMPSMSPLGHKYTVDANGYRIDVTFKKKSVINMSNLGLTERFALQPPKGKAVGL